MPPATIKDVLTTLFPSPLKVTITSYKYWHTGDIKLAFTIEHSTTTFVTTDKHTRTWYGTKKIKQIQEPRTTFHSKFNMLALRAYYNKVAALFSPSECAISGTNKANPVRTYWSGEIDTYIIKFPTRTFGDVSHKELPPSHPQRCEQPRYHICANRYMKGNVPTENYERINFYIEYNTLSVDWTTLEKQYKAKLTSSDGTQRSI